MLRCLLIPCLALLAVVQLSAQSTTGFDGLPLSAWVASVMEDSSEFRRARGAAAMRRASPDVRREFVRMLVPFLEQGPPERKGRAVSAIARLVNEGQFGQILEDRGLDLTPAVPVLKRMAEDRSEPRRRIVWFLLARTDSLTRKSLAPAARVALGDADPGVRWEAVRFLALVRDSVDVSALLLAARDSSADVREMALETLGRWQPRRAIPLYLDALEDPVTFVREAAVIGLGRAGPAAGQAIPVLLRLIGDSSANVPRTIRANAAWALSLILPRWDRDIPFQAEIIGQGMGIRSDGLGPYVNGVDSVQVTKGATLNIDLGGPRGEGRATTLKAVRPLRRSLFIDLSRPAPGGSATGLGVIKDNEAIVHVGFTHVHGRNMVSISRLEPGDTLARSERVEFQFRIEGKPHLLQMGEWTQGEFNRSIPQLSGAGTSTASIAHSDLSSWLIFAPEGSVARLWDLSDPEDPVDRGLYVVPFRMRWSLLAPP